MPVRPDRRHGRRRSARRSRAGTRRRRSRPTGAVARPAIPLRGRPRVAEPHIDVGDADGDQQHGHRDDPGLLGGEQQRGGHRPGEQVLGLAPVEIEDRGDHQRERQRRQQHLVDEVARDVDLGRRQGQQRRRRERRHRAQVPSQREHERDEQEPEHDRHQSHRLGRQPEQDLREEREVVERRPVVVGRIVGVGAVADQVRGEEPVDALVVVERVEGQFRQADGGGDQQDDERGWA